MTRAKRKGPVFTGELAKPIDLRTVYTLNRDEWPVIVEQHTAELFRIRKERLVPLAKALGIKFEHLDLTNYADLTAFYGHLAINLAVQFGIPGFQEKKPGKWPRELVHGLVEIIDWAKAEGKAKSDFQVCLDFVKDREPELKRPGQGTAAKKRARTLANLVAAARTRISRQRK